MRVSRCAGGESIFSRPLKTVCMFTNSTDMKKFFKFCVMALLVAAAVALVAYRLVNKAPSADLPLNEQVSEIFTAGGCLSCHSADPE